ncbi:MAG TPA: ankyrin repeat domain-containing protein [Oligoflexia bacterium]|nr:ankyrin repeat domain-containing protein [Oligoflexia bacterium]
MGKTTLRTAFSRYVVALLCVGLGTIASAKANDLVDEWQVEYSEEQKARDYADQLSLRNGSDWATAFVTALAQNKKALAQALFERRKNFGDLSRVVLNKSGECLASALIGKSPRFLEILLNEGLDPDCEFVPNLARPLWLSLVTKKVAEAKTLLSHGANTDFYFRSPTQTFWRQLMQEKYAGFAKKLFSTKQLIEQKDPSGTCFFSAAVVWGAEQLVAHALKKKASIAAPVGGAQDYFGLALMNSQFGAAKLIAQNTTAKSILVNFRDKTDSTYLHWCADLGESSLCETLAEIGLSLTSIDSAGRTPRDRALIAGNQKIARLLVPEGSNNPEKDFLLTQTLNKNCKSIESFFVDRNDPKGILEINDWDKNGNTLLHLASAKGSSKCVRTFLKYGASARLPNRLSETALHLSVVNDHLNSTRLLLAAGADPSDINVQGESPFHLAARHGLVPQIEALYGAGAYKKYIVYLTNSEGRTALHLATIHKQPLAMRALLGKNRAHVTAQDDYGFTAYDYAKKSQDSLAIAILEAAQ